MNVQLKIEYVDLNFKKENRDGHRDFLKIFMQVVDQSIAAHVDNKLLNKTVKEEFILERNGGSE